MEYIYPKHMQLTKKEEKEISDKLNYFFKVFLYSFWWFITLPVSLYKKLKKTHQNRLK